MSALPFMHQLAFYQPLLDHPVERNIM